MTQTARFSLKLRCIGLVSELDNVSEQRRRIINSTFQTHYSAVGLVVPDTCIGAVDLDPPVFMFSLITIICWTNDIVNVALANIL